MVGGYFSNRGLMPTAMLNSLQPNKKNTFQRGGSIPLFTKVAEFIAFSGAQFQFNEHVKACLLH